MDQPEVKNAPAPKEPTREEIQKEIDDVYTTINEDQGEYDKQLLTLSSGFLAVSLAFIKDIVPLKEAEYLWVLNLSFILLAFCIMLVLFSYQFSIAGLFKAKEYWDNQLVGKKDIEFPYGYARHIKLVNRISGVLFLMGVSSLVLFVILNLNHEANMLNDRTGVKDGAYLKTPSNGSSEDRGSHLKAPPPPPPPAAPNPKSGGSGGGNQSGRP